MLLKRRGTWRWLILALALALNGMAIAALACGPATPSGQSAGAAAAPTPEPPTATVEPTAAAATEPAAAPTATPYIYDPAIPPPIPPSPTPTELERKYPHMSSYLLRDIEEYEATAGLQGASGNSGQPPPTPERLDVALYTDTAERVDAIQRLLEDSGARPIHCDKDTGSDSFGGYCSAGYVPVSALRSLAELPGILRIDQVFPSRSDSGVGAPSSQRTAADAHGVKAWRLAGANGAGVKVGIIDYGFKDFRTRLPNLVTPAKSFCYDSSGRVHTNDISVCENNTGQRPDDDHGTEVVEALIGIAPNVSLYIANAHTRSRVKDAVDWMIRQGVDIINNSRSDVWDGPGDGTSTNSDGYLRSIDTAVAGNILWVNAAGNYAEGIWFKRGVNLVSSYRYVDFDPGPNQVWCNDITNNLEGDKQYEFHLRWEGVWDNEDSDLNLHLYRRSPSPGWVAHGLKPQNGGAMQLPLEMISATVTPGQHCLAITVAAGDSVPAWIQLLAAGQKLTHTDNSGSIMNPAESANPGMLAVGAAGYNPLAIKAFSGRGPAPEPSPNGRIKPDIVGANDALLVGTSYAAPRITGLAALVIQKLGSRQDYDTPAEIAGYLKRHAPVQPASPNPNNTWGYGFAKLPPPPPPTGLALRPDGSDPNGLLLSYARSAWDASSAHRYHFLLERLVNGQWQPFTSISRADVSPARFSSLTPGYTYRARGQRCVAAAAASTPTPTPMASLSPDPSGATFQANDVWHRFTVNASVPVKLVVNLAGTGRLIDIETYRPRRSYCPAESDDTQTRRNGQYIYLEGCGAGVGAVEIRRQSDNVLLRTYRITVR